MPDSPSPRADVKAAAKRAALTMRIADILLARGVADVPLRDLAAELGTSDRMLLYYFGGKAALVEASIGELAGRVNAILADHRVEWRTTPAEVFRTTATFMALPGMAAIRAVWADVLARGGRGEAPFSEIARLLVQGALADLEAQLAIEDGDARRRMAGAILAAIEGIWLIGMVAPGSTDGAAELLAEGFGR